MSRLDSRSEYKIANSNKSKKRKKVLHNRSSASNSYLLDAKRHKPSLPLAPACSKKNKLFIFSSATTSDRISNVDDLWLRGICKKNIPFRNYTLIFM